MVSVPRPYVLFVWSTTHTRSNARSPQNPQPGLYNGDRYACVQPFFLSFKTSISSIPSHTYTRSHTPATYRTLSIGAYQSLLFNRAASERIRLYGCERIVAGDLVDTSAQVRIFFLLFLIFLFSIIQSCTDSLQRASQVFYVG